MRIAIAYAALVVVGTINREMTGVLLGLVWMVAHWGNWKRKFIMLALFVCAYAALRFSIGEREVALTLAKTLELNLYGDNAVGGVIKNALFIPLWIVTFAALMRQPHPLRRMMLVVSAFYVPAFIVAAMWQEVRLLMPLVILAIPIAFSKKGV